MSTPLPDFIASAEFAARTPLTKGGSGRAFYRVTLTDGTRAILCQYDNSRVENALYADLSAFLASIQFPVPAVLAHEVPVFTVPDDAASIAAAAAESVCTLLLEDLGNEDLWALRDAPWQQRREAYCSALDALHQLHHHGLTHWQNAGANQPALMPGFDAALYQWEQNYFLENAVIRQAKISLSPTVLKTLRGELDALNERLRGLPQQLVHRDCQSQNILWTKGRSWFIDFQGMRVGTGFYDLGSLLWDPYVSFSDAERTELFDYYWSHGITPGLERTDLERAFRDASAQRLMQALGAYAYLGLGKRPDFLVHTRPALANLRTVTRDNPELTHLHALSQQMAELPLCPAGAQATEAI